MKILTKEEEDEHYRVTLQGGLGGGFAGLGIGSLGVWGASQRYPFFRSLTLPIKAFLITSAATFAAIVSADSYSRSYEASRHPEEGFKDAEERARQEAYATKTLSEKALQWGKENRYSIVGGSWVAAMALSLGLTGRNPYLSAQQKLVQARVYAQALTVGVLIATAAFEVGDQRKGEGKYETIQVLDPNDPEHKHLVDKKVHKESYQGEDQWKDMIETEERHMKERQDAIHKEEGQHRRQHHHKKKPHHDKSEGEHTKEEEKGDGK